MPRRAAYASSVFTGSHCHCYQIPQAAGRPPRYELIAHADNTVLGILTWLPQWARYVLVSTPGTLWASTTLGQVAAQRGRAGDMADLEDPGGRPVMIVKIGSVPQLL
jgi:hypothetical protein